MSKISQFFNPAQHLVFHQDKQGNMMGGGYEINNLLYQHKMPLFVSLDENNQQPMSGGSNNSKNPHVIPEKFSDLFRDLAVPAGLFMMPSLYRPRNYAFEVPEQEQEQDARKDSDDIDSDSDDDDGHKTKPVPNDIFDTLLSLVEPKDRIQHDVKSRRRRSLSGGDGKHRKDQKKTRRIRA